MLLFRNCKTWKSFKPWTNVRQQYKKKKLKMTVPMWNDKFELPERSYSVSNFSRLHLVHQKKHETLPSNPPIHIYINRINNRLVFKIKDGCKLELKLPETTKLFGSTKKLIDKTKDVKNATSLEVVEAVLVQCNLLENEYHHHYILLLPVNLMLIC